MNREGRLWVDVSYTRTQHGGDIGITRTVRRLFEQLGADNAACSAVAFHSQGFRHASLAAPAKSSARSPAGGEFLFRMISGRASRRLVAWTVRMIPWALLRHAWEVSSAATFNGLSHSAPAVRFTKGDVLLLADASWNYGAWRAVRIAREKGAQVVLLVYDLMPLRHPEFCFPLVPRLYQTWLVEMIKCSDAVVCISNATEQDLRRWANEQEEALALPPTGHFRLGSDAAGSTSDGPVRETMASFLRAPGPCFAAVGSFEPKKNYGLLLEAFEGLWARGETIRVLIAGRPTTDCEQLIERLSRHPEQGRLLLTVYDAFDSEVKAVYAQCRALVLPSLFEGFGLPLVEARSRGCPVIASDLEVFSELADEGVTQFPRHSSEALQAQLLDHARQDRRGQVEPMKKFSWGDSARECGALIERLLRDR